MKGFYFTLLILFFLWFTLTNTFDSVHDVEQEFRRWKTHGDYTYANSSLSREIQQLRPPQLQRSGSTTPIPLTGDFERQGIWLIKHDTSGSNVWNLTYSLTHLLFAQAWVTLLAHPNVPIVFRTSGNQVVGKFWSDGRAWCDAVFGIGLKNTFTAEVHTLNDGEYALIDKVVLGIMGNITALKHKKIENPCLMFPFTQDNAPPDVVRKDEVNEIRRNIEATTSPAPPDMRTTPTTLKPMVTSMRSYKTERGGAKCDCTCTCVKPNATTTVKPFPNE